MVNFNPSFPEVLGNEWLANIGATGRVWAGAPAVMARYASTATETITQLKLSATVNPLLTASAPTLIDVIEEGNEDTVLFTPRGLIPNGVGAINGWTTGTGSTSNLHLAVEEDPTRWPGPAQDDWIQNVNGFQDFECSVDAAAFAPAGALVNSRIGFVEIRAILGANTGFRKLRVGLRIGGVDYQPAGGNLRDVHGYGSTFVLWYGEINPATSLPWTPADIAGFAAAGTSRLLVRSQTATATHFPKVFAIRLWVYHVPENRAAVGVYRRPEELTSRLTNVATDALRTMPAGTANWAKLTGRNYLFYWRQSVSPSEYTAVVADDVRWNYVRQNLGPVGQPPNYSPPPGSVLAAQNIAYDQYGRPAESFVSTPGFSATSAAGLVMVRSDAANSTDSQPYRLDVDDLESVTSTQKLGQRVVPGSTQTYLGVRLTIIPPATGDPTLTVAVIRISDSVQIGGTFTITASAARALPAATGGWRYVTGFLSSGAALTSAIPYEIRLTSTAGGTWTAAMPDASLGASTGFGGTTSGAFIGATHLTDRDLSVNLVRQPDPPTAVTASIANVAITTYAASVTTVQHVNVSWTAPAVGMGASFARYELERQLDSGAWQLIAKLTTTSLLTFQDHEAPRNTVCRYRCRAVGTDGRFSAWNQSGTVTPVTTGSLVILTSNHAQSLEAVLIHDRESSYPIISTEHDEIVAIHGADYQVAFMEAEDRGVGWRTKITVSQIVVPAKGGQHVLTSLLALVRSTDIPYVCVMDQLGTRILGHAKLTDADQTQPAHRYTAFLDVTPTHTEPEPVTLP